MSDDDKKDADEQMARIDKAFDTLSEHFDTVSIFCTRHINNSTGTLRWNRGGGNWFARYGQIREWLLREESTFKQPPEE